MFMKKYIYIYILMFTNVCDAPNLRGSFFFFFFFTQEFTVLLFYIPKIYETILF